MTSPDGIAQLIDEALESYARVWSPSDHANGYASACFRRDGSQVDRTQVISIPAVSLSLSLYGAKAPEYMLTYRIAISRWIDGGSTALRPIKSRAATLLEIDGLLRGSLASTWEAADRGLVDCAQCQCTMTWDRVAGRHFAGVYCAGCWAKYKEDNSTRCLQCGFPHYSCVC